MTFEQFIARLDRAHWTDNGDAQYEHIRAMWSELYPAWVLIEDLEKQRDELEELLHDIGDFAHERSKGPANYDDLWEVRRMAYRQ